MKEFIVQRIYNKDESTKAKEIFIIESERKANLVKKQKDVKSNFKATLSGDKKNQSSKEIRIFEKREDEQMK